MLYTDLYKLYSMQKYFSLFLLVTFLPSVVHAQSSLQSLLIGFTKFLDSIVIPFLLAIAFFVFAINAVRYFIFQSTSEDGREKAKALAIYSVFAFVLIIIFWGIINLLSTSIGLDGVTQPEQDYVKMKGG